MQENTPKPNGSQNQLKGFGALVLICLLGWYFIGGGQEKIVNHEMERIERDVVPQQMQRIENQVANDAVQQYEIAERGGDLMQMYTQASLCAASFLQAKDEVNYKKWLDIEHRLAKQVGMPE